MVALFLCGYVVFFMKDPIDDTAPITMILNDSRRMLQNAPGSILEENQDNDESIPLDMINPNRE